MLRSWSEVQILKEFYTIIMKHLYVPMSWPEDKDILWIKFLSFVSFFCSENLSGFIIAHKVSYIQRQT